MLNLGTQVSYKGVECEVVGKKLLCYGVGPVVYELVVSKYWRTYRTKLRELRKIGNFITYISDKRLRNIQLKDASDSEKEAIFSCPVVGFTDVPPEELVIITA